MEVAQETEGIAKFKASSTSYMDPSCRGSKKEWLKMQYCITREEVDWIIKDWPAQWNYQ
jgi:hypothetical protein